MVKIHFHLPPPTFCLFGFVKHLNSGQKLPIRTAHHTFLESRHPEVTKTTSKLYQYRNKTRG